MASGVNIKMGVSGVSDVKRDINAVKDSLKTLDSNLQLVEAQFKATGDKETYLQTKTELLQGKLTGLQSIADDAKKALATMTESGVDKSSKAFQDMQRTASDAQTQILNTKMQIENLSAAEGTAEKSASDLDKKLTSIGKNVSVKNVVDAIDGITGGMERAAKSAARLGRKLVSSLMDSGKWADEINTTAQKWEISPERLQRIRQTADIIDTDAEAILAAQQKMRKTLAGDKGKETLEDVLELELEGKNPEDLFWEIGDALMGMDEAFDKEAAASQLFGRSWRELLPLFQAGREQYEEMNESWDVVSEDQLDSLQKMDDEYQKLQIQMENLKRSAIAEFAEPMTGLMEQLNGLMADFGKWLASDEGKATVDNAVNTIKGALEWVIENKDTVIRALEGIVLAWGGLKLTGGLLKIYELVTGLKGLGGLKALSGAGEKAAEAASGKSGGGWLAGLGKKAAMAGIDMSVMGPLAALAAAGAAGAAMINANLNDKNLNQVYGDENGLDLLDRMTAEQFRLAKEYEAAYAEGGAYDLREALQASLQELGIYNDEQGVGLLESIFDERLRGMDIDGLVSKFDRLAAAAEELTGTTDGRNRDSETSNTIKGLPGQIGGAVAGAVSGIKVWLNGQVVGSLVAAEVSRQIASNIP